LHFKVAGGQATQLCSVHTCVQDKHTAFVQC
jgi:hypothetical protein